MHAHVLSTLTRDAAVDRLSTIGITPSVDNDLHVGMFLEKISDALEFDTLSARETLAVESEIDGSDGEGIGGCQRCLTFCLKTLSLCLCLSGSFTLCLKTGKTGSLLLLTGELKGFSLAALSFKTGLLGG